MRASGTVPAVGMNGRRSPDGWTVGNNEFTCAAGAGSILSGDYHGFLRHGVLT